MHKYLIFMSRNAKRRAVQTSWPVLVFRLVSPWLLCRLVRTLKDSLMEGVLEDWGDYTSADIARMMPYADLCFSGCALFVTGIVSCKRRLSKAALRRYATVKNALREA